MREHKENSQLKPSVWIKDNLVIFYGASIDVKKHRHHSIQLVWTTKAKKVNCLYSGGTLTGSFIIGSQVEHQLQLEEGWILLVEPTSILGMHLERLLSNAEVLMLNDILASCEKPSKPIVDPLSLINLLFTRLGVDLDCSINMGQITDKRILKLIEKMNLCLLGSCQKPASWRAADVASDLSLSESRFLHLFRSQVGVAWRPYLRWRRLTCTSHALVQGMSATDAAYTAGFSDLAHLSRTFQAMFGLSIVQAKEVFFKS